MCKSATVTKTKTPALIGSAEVCTRLEIDRSTLTRWVQLGHAKPAMRLPGRNGAMLFDRAEVERLARERAS